MRGILPLFRGTRELLLDPPQDDRVILASAGHPSAVDAELQIVHVVVVRGERSGDAAGPEIPDADGRTAPTGVGCTEKLLDELAHRRLVASASGQVPPVRR